MHTQADVVIIGAGLAGMVCAMELINDGVDVILVDRDTPERAGGLARDAFGGMMLVDTPIQRRFGIADSPGLAYRDWLSFARFGKKDYWPVQWAKLYVQRCRPDVHDFLRACGIRFFPAPQWVERGHYGEGNSVPRYHVVWGTGLRLATRIVEVLDEHPKRSCLRSFFNRKAERLLVENGRVCGCGGTDIATGREFSVRAGVVVVACGGINGDLDLVRNCWDTAHSPAPVPLLNGAHRYADGLLHDEVARQGGAVTHLEWMWNYAAGVHMPGAEDDTRGLSLIPPKSALWLDAEGKRFGPEPLITGFDTWRMVHRICRTRYQYSWQILNMKIAYKELAASGADANPAFRDRNWLQTLRTLLKGNRKLVDGLISDCPDFVVADTVTDLAMRMNALVGHDRIEADRLRKVIGAYDNAIERGSALFNDPQLRRIAQLRSWRGDRLRTCKFQSILDPRAGPLLAIREFIISRKSMGGILTDTRSRVLTDQGEPISGLYAAGEAAGFGGGGSSGNRSLEGTFLSNCILNARMAARDIAGTTRS